MPDTTRYRIQPAALCFESIDDSERPCLCNHCSSLIVFHEEHETQACPVCLAKDSQLRSLRPVVMHHPDWFTMIEARLDIEPTPDHPRRLRIDVLEGPMNPALSLILGFTSEEQIEVRVLQGADQWPLDCIRIADNPRDLILTFGPENL